MYEFERTQIAGLGAFKEKKDKRLIAINLDNEYKNLLCLKFDKASSCTLIREGWISKH